MGYDLARSIRIRGDTVPQVPSDETGASVPGREQSGAGAERAPLATRIAAALDAGAEPNELLELLADERRTRDRFAGLQRATVELSAALSFEEVAVAMREEGLAAAGADVALAMLARGDELELLFCHGLGEERLHQLERVPLAAEVAVARAVRGRRPLFLGPAAAERAFPALVRGSAGGTRGSWAFVPLFAGGDAIGVLGVMWRMRRAPFDAEERGLVLGLAAQCALALERVRLTAAERASRADAQRAAAEARAVAEVQEHVMAVVGHDLRSPLQAISLGASRLVQRGGLDEAQAAIARRISDAARRASALISDLLDFARARQGLGMRLVRAPVDLAALCGAVVAEQRELHAKRDLSVSCDGDARGTWDPVRISQLVQNLVTNALAHGGDAARVEVRIAGERDAVRLAVWNDGPLVPAAELPRLLGPLPYGVDGSARGGLGLVIVREIALAHGGTMDVRSSAAEGTSFQVRLPRSAPEAVARASSPGGAARDPALYFDI
jgi:signal transduction histidine kinase